MPRVPYKFPAPGEDPISDRIRERRGARGLTPLDATLLNAPVIADGWNKFIGALRTGSSLPDDIRELMILRIAVLNNAAFEWIQHEHVGRAGGLTSAQLAAIQSGAHNEPSNSVFSPLQKAVLAFTDASTQHAHVPPGIFETLKSELSKHLAENTKDGVTVDRQLVEASATVGGYNLVSRFLLALDVDDRASESVPRINYTPLPTPGPQVSIQEYPVYISPGMTLHTRVHFNEALPHTGPAIIFINSLLTSLEMWDPIIPFLSSSYTLITFDQRGHGQSSVPPPGEKCTIEQLASDVARVLDFFQLKTIHGVVGVSQGGATALSFGAQFPSRVRRLVACDTQPVSPEANIKAWDDRIALARRSEKDGGGMKELARQTAKRWFPAPDSPFASEGTPENERLCAMIERTGVDGFASGAAALQGYDLLDAGLISSLRGEHAKEKGFGVMLVAGELDGKLPAGLQKLREEIIGESGEDWVKYEEIKGSGHLPMLDHPEDFAKHIKAFMTLY